MPMQACCAKLLTPSALCSGRHAGGVGWGGVCACGPSVRKLCMLRCSGVAAHSQWRALVIVRGLGVPGLRSKRGRHGEALTGGLRSGGGGTHMAPHEGQGGGWRAVLPASLQLTSMVQTEQIFLHRGRSPTEAKNSSSVMACLLAAFSPCRLD